MDDKQIEDDVRSPRRSKKPVIVAGLAALFALAMGIAATLFLRANSVEDPQPRESTVVNGHEILPTITGHAPKDPFIVKLSEEGRDRVREKLDDGADFEDIVSVFVDDDYTQYAWGFTSSALDGVEVSPFEQPNVAVQESQGLEHDSEYGTLPIRAGEEQEWGIYETYYVVQYVDGDGEDLDTPLVQPYTIDVDALDSVDSFEISEPDDEGNVEFSWDEVNEADTYLVVKSNYVVSADSHEYLIIGETDDTKWSSAETFSQTKMGSEDRPKAALTQNNGLATFFVHAEIYKDHALHDSDEIDEINEDFEQYAVGVVATDGQRFSHYIPQDVSEKLGSLPHRHADITWEERFDSFPVDSLTELGDLTMPYVTLDGSVEETVMQVDPDAEIDTSRVITVREDDSGEPVKKDRDVYKVPVGGVGTMLSREISVEITDASLENQISEFNKAQLELAEELGISTE